MRTLWNNVLYRILDADGVLLYVGASTNPGDRIDRHSKTQPWWPDVSTITLEHFASWESLAEAELAAIRTENPKYNLLHSKPPVRKPRRNTGEGSLFQRSSDGLWVGRVTVNGRRKQVSSSSREETRRKLADLRRSAEL